MAGVALGDGAYVWATSVDGLAPRTPDSITRAFAHLCDTLERETGQPWPFRFHDLRDHLSATELIGGGVDARTVASRLGHADPSLTLRVYAHSGSGAATVPPPSCLAPGLHCRRPVRSKGVHNRRAYSCGPVETPQPRDKPRARPGANPSGKQAAAEFVNHPVGPRQDYRATTLRPHLAEEGEQLHPLHGPRRPLGPQSMCQVPG